MFDLDVKVWTSSFQARRETRFEKRIGQTTGWRKRKGATPMCHSKGSICAGLGHSSTSGYFRLSSPQNPYQNSQFKCPTTTCLTFVNRWARFEWIYKRPRLGGKKNKPLAGTTSQSGDWGDWEYVGDVRLAWVHYRVVETCVVGVAAPEGQFFLIVFGSIYRVSRRCALGDDR